MLNAIEHLLHIYEGSQTAKLYKLTRNEFIYLYLTAEGHEHPEMMDYFDCHKDKLYRLRNHVVRKMRACNLYHAMTMYIRTELDVNTKKIL